MKTQECSYCAQQVSKLNVSFDFPDVIISSVYMLLFKSGDDEDYDV